VGQRHLSIASVHFSCERMKVLLVEDESKTVQFVTRGLVENGFNVDSVGTGDGAIQLAGDHEYDLVILDIMLPGIDGRTVLSRLRASNNHTPVIFLTARDQVEDRVSGLELGADDYLIKPFAFSELLARIRTVLRRHSGEQPRQLQMADLQLDLMRRRAFRASQQIELTAKEFTLLWLFMRHSGEVLSRAIIAEKVWDMNFDGDTNVVDVAVRRLRRKIDEPFGRPLIHTIRGMGYVMEAR